MIECRIQRNTHRGQYLMSMIVCYISTGMCGCSLCGCGPMVGVDILVSCRVIRQPGHDGCHYQAALCGWRPQHVAAGQRVCSQPHLNQRLSGDGAHGQGEARYRGGGGGSRVSTPTNTTTTTTTTLVLSGVHYVAVGVVGKGLQATSVGVIRL